MTAQKKGRPEGRPDAATRCASLSRFTRSRGKLIVREIAGLDVAPRLGRMAEHKLNEFGVAFGEAEKVELLREEHHTDSFLLAACCFAKVELELVPPEVFGRGHAADVVTVLDNLKGACVTGVETFGEWCRHLANLRLVNRDSWRLTT